MNNEQAEAIEKICSYLNNEQSVINNRKGILLIGNSGSGKTAIIKSFKKLSEMLFSRKVGFVTCTEINERYKKIDVDTGKRNGDLALLHYTNRKSNEMIFDDIGDEETTVIDYGNRFSCMAHIFTERHKHGAMTHGTTNLTLKKVLDIYGGRVESRFHEMFNIIVLGGKSDSIDFRKIK